MPVLVRLAGRDQTARGLPLGNPTARHLAVHTRMGYATNLGRYGGLV
jgi:hypothetical protein